MENLIPNNQLREINRKDAVQAWELIRQSHKIIIISHRNPDPDAIGSNLALSLCLQKFQKQVTSACIDLIPNNCKSHPLSSNFTQNLDLPSYDLIISVDCGSPNQVAFGEIYPDLFTIKPFINIDHHISNNHFGTINLVYTNFCSTCEILYNLLKIWNIPLNQEIATLLLFGLYYDTGSFKHSNVTSTVLKTAGNLMNHGANLKLITENLFHNFNKEKFHLWGDILYNFQISKKNVATAVVKQDTFKKNYAQTEDLGDLINYLVSTKNTDFAVLVHENNKGNIKGSLRTEHDDINLSEIATSLGGGGHKKASGFSFPGKIETKITWKIN